MLVDSKEDRGYDKLVDKIFPRRRYIRLTNFKYLTNESCTLLEKIS